MSSKTASSFRTTSAWRFSALSTVAFAAGTALAFLIVYRVVEGGIRERSDTWLLGESTLLAQVAASSSPGEMRERMMEEVAELARNEVLPMPGPDNGGEAPVFFLALNGDGTSEVWVGPGEEATFVRAIRGQRFAPGTPSSLAVRGWDQPFRVVARPGSDGKTIFLGFVDRSALALMDHVADTFLLVWAAMLLFGFVVSWVAARRILGRVERITRTASQIGSQGLDRRIPAGRGRDEITRLTRTFNEMLDRIQTSVEQIRTVSDAVAHDMRSPLTAIRGNLELAVTRGDPEALEEAAAGALEGLDQLLRTLTASLDLAEAGAGALRVDRRPVDLAGMVREMVEIYTPAAEERGLTLETDAPPGIVASLDPDLTRRAVANLLDNALQHLPAGCRVRLRVERNADDVILGVEDDGPGFPADVGDRVFERGVKGDASRGFGIGLALVRIVARAHGGEARVAPPAGGRGAALRIAFPDEA